MAAITLPAVSTPRRAAPATPATWPAARADAGPPVPVLARNIRAQVRPPSGVRNAVSGQPPARNRRHRGLVARITSGRSSRSTFTATKCSLMSFATSGLRTIRGPSRGTSGTTPRQCPAGRLVLRLRARKRRLAHDATSPADAGLSAGKTTPRFPRRFEPELVGKSSRACAEDKSIFVLPVLTLLAFRKNPSPVPADIIAAAILAGSNRS